MGEERRWLGKFGEHARHGHTVVDVYGVEKVGEENSHGRAVADPAEDFRQMSQTDF